MKESKEIEKIIEIEYPSLLKSYCWFHSNPELPNHEENTALVLGDELIKCGFQVFRNVGGFGVVGLFENGSGPTILFRAELDALPILEDTDLSFQSHIYQNNIDDKVTPVMHACGHDLHLTCAIGIARVCNQLHDYWRGTLIIIGEPAEEIGSGARAMISDNLFSKIPSPQYSFAIHVDPNLLSGKVGFIDGIFSIGREDFLLKIMLKNDWKYNPIVYQNKFIIFFSKLLSLFLERLSKAYTLFRLECAILCFNLNKVFISNKYFKDDAYFENVVQIPFFRSIDSFELRFIFCYSNIKVKEKIILEFKNSLDYFFKLFKLNIESSTVIIKKDECIPPIINNSELTHFAKNVAKENLGNEKIETIYYLFGVDDYSLFVKNGIKNCYFKLGSGFAYKNQNFPLHSNHFSPDIEPTLKTGILAMSSILIKTFQESP